MAEENEENAESTEAPESSGGKKKILIIVGAVVLLAVIGAGAAFFLMSGGSEGDDSATTSSEATAQEDGEEASKEEPSSESEDEEEKAEGEKPDASEASDEESKPSEGSFDFGRTFNLKPFHINLGNPLENRYLRMEVAIEYKGNDDQRKELEARLPQLRDAILTVASRKTREFLLGPDGKDQLRLEMLNRVNQYMDKKVEAVYITDILIE